MERPLPSLNLLASLFVLGVSVTASAISNLRFSHAPLYDFGQVNVGRAAEITIQLINDGDSQAFISGGWVGDPQTPDLSPLHFKGNVYPGGGGTCGFVLPAGAQCNLVLEFFPATAFTTSTEALVVEHSGGQVSMSLTGYALPKLGGFDPTFGGGLGYVGNMFRTDAEAHRDHAVTLDLAADGKVFVAGHSYRAVYGTQHDVAISKYLANGNLDTTFDGDGKRLLTIDTGDKSAARDVVALSDGGVLIAGDSNLGDSRGIFVAKLLASGANDTSFAGGTGLAIPTSVDLTASAAAKMKLLPDGKILIVGDTIDRDVFLSAGRNGLLVRLNADGSIDASFGSRGIAWFHDQFKDRFFEAVVLADGKILVAGEMGTKPPILPTDPPLRYWQLLARFHSNGTLDTSFGNAGTVRIEIETAGTPKGLVVDSQGRIIFGAMVLGWLQGQQGNPSLHDILYRFSADGTLDTSFGSNVLKDTFSVERQVAVCPGMFYQEDLVMDAAGRLLMGGEMSGDEEFGFCRFSANGQPDGNIPVGGGTIGTGTDSGSGKAMEIQPDGKVLMAGDYDFYYTDPNGNLTFGTKFGLARFWME